MAWGILLSKYPRSILTEELPLLVLAMLEHAGLATDSDLEEMAGDKRSEVKRTLFKLQLNSLVEYGDSHVRVTEAGRELLERLSLHEQVINEILDSLALKGRQRKDFKLVLGSYRRHSFRLYQNSLCSLRLWGTLSRSSPDEDQVNSYSFAGKRSLLLRDLRNWCMHSAIGTSILDDVTESLRNLILLDIDDQRSIRKLPDDLQGITHLFLQCIVTTNYDKALERAVELHDAKKWLPLFQDFHKFQASWEPDVWFDKWAIECKSFDQRKGKSLDRYIEKMRNSLLRARNEDLENKHGNLVRFFDSWRPTTNESSIGENFLSHLAVASSMSDLSRRTQTPEASLRPLIENIMDACRRILSPTFEEPDTHERAKSTHGVGGG